MKPLQKIIRQPLFAASIGLNLALAVTAVMLWSLVGKKGPLPETMAAALTVPKSVTEKQSDTTPQPKPFQWSQLDAPDFVTFVNNLRGIGCPEPTIRDIVAGELKEIYDQKLLQITQVGDDGILEASQEGGTDLNSASHATAVSRNDSRSALEQLQTEQTELLASLLAPSASPPVVVNTVPAVMQVAAAAAGPLDVTKPGKGSGISPNDAITQIPAAFLAGNADELQGNPQALTTTVSDSTLDASTAQVLNQMRSRFADALQTAAADPSSPEYLEEWRRARRDSDEAFSSMYGGDALILAQMEANRAAAVARNQTKTK